MMSDTRMAVMVAPFRRRTEHDRRLLVIAQRLLLERFGIVPIFLPDTLRSVVDDEEPEERTQALEASGRFVRSMAAHPAAVMVVAADRWSEGCERDVLDWIAAGREPIWLWQLRRDGFAGKRLLDSPWRCVACTWTGGAADPDALRCPVCRAHLVPVREV